MENKLNVVDEKGNIIGKETRGDMHNKELLHQVINVWFFTPKGEIILQHRSKDKDIFSNLLDATAGGHVEMGEDYIKAALREVEEETKMLVSAGELRLIDIIRNNSYDPVAKVTHNVLKAVYAYKYDGEAKDLKVEDEEALGFEAWPIDRILNISDEDREKVIPPLLAENFSVIFKKIKELM